MVVTLGKSQPMDRPQLPSRIAETPSPADERRQRQPMHRMECLQVRPINLCRVRKTIRPKTCEYTAFEPRADLERLNQWIIGQHQLGPGGDPTLAPFGIYPAQLRPFEQPFGQDTGVPYWSGGQAGYVATTAPKVTSWSAPFDQSNGMMISAYTSNAGLGGNPIPGSTAMGQANGPTQQYWEQMLNGEQ